MKQLDKLICPRCKNGLFALFGCIDGERKTLIIECLICGRISFIEGYERTKFEVRNC